MKQSEFSEKMVAERVTELVTQSTLTVEEAAGKCGIDTERFRKLMAAKGRMKVYEMIGIAKAFDVSTDYILGLYPHPFPAPKGDADCYVYERLRNVPKEKVQEEMLKLQEEIKNRL